MAMPSKNMFYTDIPKSACVVDRGRYFEVQVGRKRYLAYWDGQHARQAQLELARRAKKGCKK